MTQGGSTLTQQLAKNLFLSPERTLNRKLQEAVLAIWLETKFSKDEILQLYMNRVYFGGGANGIDKATRAFYNKGPEELTIMEAATLAGVLKAPSNYNPAKRPEEARQRATLVLKNMVQEGYISDRRHDGGAGRLHQDDTGRLCARHAICGGLDRRSAAAAHQGQHGQSLVIETTHRHGVCN